MKPLSSFWSFVQSADAMQWMSSNILLGNKHSYAINQSMPINHLYDTSTLACYSFRVQSDLMGICLTRFVLTSAMVFYARMNNQLNRDYDTAELVEQSMTASTSLDFAYREYSFGLIRSCQNSVLRFLKESLMVLSGGTLLDMCQSSRKLSTTPKQYVRLAS